MKLLVSVIVLGLFVTAFAPRAEARICGHGAHRAHCVAAERFAQRRASRQMWRYGEKTVVIAAPQPDVGYIPYEQYYPPMPATIFDLPPERGFFN
ncbi:MAG: hypothetical protein WCF20_11680 [Methylovirgula sp.]